MEWFEKIKQKKPVLFSKENLLLVVCFIAIAIFFFRVTASVVNLKMQSHKSYERQHELNRKSVIEANLRQIERQKAEEKINDLKKAANQVWVPAVVLLVFWLLLKVVLRQIIEFMEQSRQKKGFVKFIFIFTFIVMILVVLLQVVLGLFAYWMSTDPSSGGSIMGGLGAYVIGVFATKTYWYGTLGGLFLILLSGQWRYFFQTLFASCIAFLLLSILFPGLGMLLLMGLSYEIFQITWAFQHPPG